jgi:hypothetical protein
MVSERVRRTWVKSLDRWVDTVKVADVETAQALRDLVANGLLDIADWRDGPRFVNTPKGRLRVEAMGR